MISLSQVINFLPFNFFNHILVLQKNDDKGVIIISDDDEDLPGPAPAPVEMTDSIVISDEDSDEPRERTESYVPVTGFNKYELGLMNHGALFLFLRIS